MLTLTFSWCMRTILYGLNNEVKITSGLQDGGAFSVLSEEKNKGLHYTSERQLSVALPTINDLVKNGTGAVSYITQLTQVHSFYLVIKPKVSIFCFYISSQISKILSKFSHSCQTNWKSSLNNTFYVIHDTQQVQTYKQSSTYVTYTTYKNFKF